MLMHNRTQIQTPSRRYWHGRLANLSLLSCYELGILIHLNMLKWQVTSPVQWETTVKTLLTRGLKKSYELGPGKVRFRCFCFSFPYGICLAHCSLKLLLETFYRAKTSVLTRSIFFTQNRNRMITTTILKLRIFFFPNHWTRKIKEAKIIPFFVVV